MISLYDNDVRELMTRLQKTPAPENPVAFYGSSSIRMWDNLARDFSDVPTVNLGFGGSTLEACAHFFEQIVVPVAPRALVIYAGDNDLGHGQTPDQVVASFGDLQNRINAAFGENFPFLFLGVKPSFARWHLIDVIQETNARIAGEISTRDTGGRFVDLFPAMLNEREMPRPELFAEDGLHLSQAGYEVWREAATQNRAGIF